MTHIGYAIRLLRVKLNVPQNQLALDCGLSITTLSQIERGKKIPALKTVTRICAGLDIPTLLLFLLAIEYANVPISKKKTHTTLYPAIRKLSLQLLNDDHSQLLLALISPAKVQSEKTEL